MSDQRNESPQIKERVKALLDQHNGDLSYAQAKAVIGDTLKEEYYKKLRQKWRHDRPSTTKPASKNGDQKLGEGKDVVVALLDQHGVGLTYAQAVPLMKDKGVEIGAEWYRRLVNEYAAQKGIPVPRQAPMPKERQEPLPVPTAPKVPVTSGPAAEISQNGQQPTFGLSDITATRELVQRLGKINLVKLVEAL